MSEEKNFIEIYATNEASRNVIEGILDDYEYEDLPYLKKQKNKEDDLVKAVWVYEDHFEDGIKCIISLRKDEKLI